MTPPVQKRKVAIGLLGVTKDAGKPSSRWNRWRPTIGLHQQSDIKFDRMELMHQDRWGRLGEFIADDIKTVSPATEVHLHKIEFNDPWDLEEVYGALFDFARNYQFDEENEEYYIHLTTGTHIAQICWFLLAEARFIPAKLAQTSPPVNRQDDDKSGDLAIVDLDLSRYTALQSRFDVETADATEFLKSGISTRSERFNHLIAQIESVALTSKEPILLLGAQGTGKSLLAKRIYDLKQRRYNVRGHFVQVNCSTVRGDAGMSMLFGHRRGAMGMGGTERRGLLRQADKGILFLDEIDELGLDEQAMILHAVENGRFYPLGSDGEVESRFQLIAGANRDLAELVREGKFRADLYSRLNLWTFALPALSERREDIAPNIEYELAKAETTLGEKVVFNLDAEEKYLRFAESPDASWEGNFRDLSASVLRMCTLAPRGRITTAMVDEEIDRLRSAWQGRSENAALLEIDSFLNAPIDDFDRAQLAHVVSVCRQSKSLSDAGRKLFAVSREGKKIPNDADRLRKYLAKFDLGWENIARR